MANKAREEWEKLKSGGKSSYTGGVTPSGNAARDRWNSLKTTMSRPSSALEKPVVDREEGDANGYMTEWQRKQELKRLRELYTVGDASAENKEILQKIRELSGVKPNLVQRAANTVSAGVKSSAAQTVNVGGSFLEGMEKLNDAAFDSQYAEQIKAANNSITYWTGVLNDAKSTDEEKARAEQLIERERSWLESIGEFKEMQTKDISAAAEKVYQSADKLDQSAEKDVEKAQEGLGTVGKFLVEAGVGGTQLAGDIAFGLATGGGAMLPMVVRSFGGSAQEARQAGGTYGEQVAYGLGSAALAAATESISNIASPLAKAFGAGFADDAVKGVAGKLNNSQAGRVVLSALSEGGEEAVESLIQPLLQRITYNEEAGYSAETVSDMVHDFLLGAVLGGTVGGVGEVSDSYAAKNIYGDNAQELVDEALDLNEKNRTALKANKRLAEGKTVSGATLNNLIKQNENLIRQRKNDEVEASKAAAADKAVETMLDDEAEDADKNAAVDMLLENAGVKAEDTARNVRARKAIVEPVAARDFSEEEARYIVQEGAKEFGNAASSVVNSYMRGQDPQLYMAQARLAFNYGKTMSEEKGLPYALKSPSLKSMDETQIRSLFNAGRMQAKSIPVSAVKGTGKAVLGDGLDYSLLSPVQKTQVNALAAFAKATGYTIELVESKADAEGNYTAEQGSFNTKTGAIRIDINAGRNKVTDTTHYAMVRVASHEITHSFKKNAPQQYVALRDYVTGILADKGRFEDLVDTKMRDLGIGHEAAVDEVVADGCEMLLRDTRFINNLAKENRTLFEKIRDAIRKFVKKIRDAFEGVKIAHEEAQLLKDAENIQELWDEALARSVENVAAAKHLNAGTQSGKLDAVKTSLREDLRNGKARKEDRESFLRRATGEGLRIFEGENAAYGYRPVRWESSGENARQVQRELTELGIDAEIIEGDIFWNLNGISSTRKVPQATTVEKKKIFVNAVASLEPKNAAGHEAYHLWSETVDGAAYQEEVRANINFSSKSFVRYQSAIANAYAKKLKIKGDKAEIDVNDEDQLAALMEEVFAYISGDIHEGVNDDFLRPMFVDYDAVKAAWSKLCEHQRSDSGVVYSKRTQKKFEALSYKEISEMQQELFQRERSLTERKREANNNPELLQAMDDFHGLFDEMRELLPKRRQGTATQAELDRIDKIKALRDQKLQRVSELQESLGLKAMEEEDAEIRQMNEELRVAADAAWKREGAERENAAIAKAGVSAQEYFRKKALKAFKTTTNFNEAGYLLPDGKLLNFSGGERNHRYRDHREIGEIYEATQGAEALNRFLSDGNIRIMAESPGIDLASGVEPTAEQYAAIRRFVKSHGTQEGQFFVDFSDAEGHKAGNYAYEGRVNADRVINDIKYYYAHGEVREQSVTSQYHYSFRTGYIPTDRSILTSYVPKDSDSDMVKRHIAEYQKNVEELRKLEQTLREQREQMRSLTGDGNKMRRAMLRDEIIKTQNRIQIASDQLLRKEKWMGVRTVLNREKDALVKQARAEEREKLKKYREQRWDTESRRKLRERITYRVKTLDKMLRNPTDDRHIPDGLQSAILDFCEAFTENTSVFPKKRLDSIRAEYAALESKASETSLADLYDESIKEMLEYLGEVMSGKRLSELNVEQLNMVKAIADHFAFMVKNENEIFVQGRKVKLDETAQGVIAAANEHKRLLPEISKGETLDAFDKFLTSGNLRPVNFFRDKGGDMRGLFQSLLDAQDEYAFRMDAAKEFVEDVKKTTGYSEWSESEKKLEFTNSAGQRVKLDIQQAMSLLATYERELRSGNLVHVTQGGFLYERDVTGDIFVGGVKVPVLKQVVQAEKAKAHPMSVEDMDKVRSWLGEVDPRVLDYMEKMVEYLSTTMSEYGNETSMQLHGYKKFGEGYYFPIKSAQEFLQQEPGKAGFDESRWKHKGFTKATVKGANNPFVLRGFDEVWSNHVSQMCMYSTMAVPQDAFVRVMNYKTPVDPTGSTASVSVKSEIRGNYGQKSLDYIDTYLSDINGGLLTDPRAGALNRMVSLFKKNAVFASASVALQQPSAVVRAMTMVDGKYFAKAFAEKPNFKEAKQYSGLAIIKEIGGFDTTTGRGGAEWLMQTTPEGLKAKAKALVQFGEKDTGYRDSVMTALPQKMDEISWGYLWNAIKAEVEDTTDFEAGTEKFYEAVAARFEEVIENTQVYDSVLTRSENMRGKDSLIKAATSFMAEPTVTMNMFVTAAQDAIAGKEGAKARLAKTAFVLALSIVVNNLLKAIATAPRDKDEDETIAEKYLEAFVSGVKSDFDPLGYAPILRDVKSIWQGYTVEASYASVISDVYDAWNKFAKNQTVESGFDVVNSVAALFGVPAKNLKRDIMSVINIFAKSASLDETSARGFWNAFRNGMGWMPGVDDAMEKALNADRRGNDAQRKKALEELAKLYEDKAKQFRLEGKEDAAKKAKSSLKSSITAYLKPLYQAAKTQAEKNRIKSLALRVYVGGQQLYSGYDFERYWDEE